MRSVHAGTHSNSARKQEKSVIMHIESGKKCKTGFITRV